MNICMVSYSFYESDTRVVQYAKTLVDRGDNVDVVALRQEGTLPYEVVDGVNVYRIQARCRNERSKYHYLIRVLRFFLLASAAVTKKHFRKHYDVIHVHSVPDPLVFVGLIPKLTGARIILDIHDILPEFYASKFSLSKHSLTFKLLVWSERISTAFADYTIIANEIWHERLLSRSVKPSRCLTVRNYPDPSLFWIRPPRNADGRFVLIYPGSLNRHQGLDIAIRAFALAAVTIPSAEFHIYGDGGMKEELVELARELNVPAQVRFYPHVSAKAIAAVMADADVAVVPKRASDDFGNEAVSGKIMEFMALGVPIIASRTKIESHYHDDSMLLFFESDNPEDLARKIVLLRNNPDLRGKLRASALKYVEQNKWEAKKRDYLNVIDGLPLDRHAASWKGVSADKTRAV